MKIDEFDSYILDQDGINSQSFFLDIYGEEINSKSNARKYKIGIMKHLKYKQIHATQDSVPTKDKVELCEDGSRVVHQLLLLSKEDIDNPAALLKKIGFDPLQWELVGAKFDAKSWDVTMKLYQSQKESVNDEGNKKRVRVPDRVHKETNWGYDTEIRVKPTKTPLTVDVLKNVFENLSIPKHKEYKYTSNGRMLEFPLVDLHIGKSDLDIALQLAETTVSDFLSRAKDYEKIIFPIGNDFFQIDTPSGTTTAGTYVETAAPWHEIFLRGTQFILNTISELRRLAPVDVIYIPGNHDKMASFWLARTVKAHFRDTDSVTVDLDISNPRKYREFGLGMVGFSHGNQEKKRIEEVMQVEEPEMWGRTKFREFHLGHEHRERVWEKGGIIFRWISSLTESDGWHTDKAFIGAIQKAQAFEWDKQKGIESILNSVVKYKYTDDRL